MKYLIVDDEPLSHDVIVNFASSIDDLELVNQFLDPKEAILWLHENEVDILFLDMKMPKLTGFEVLNQLRVTPEIIIASAHQEFAIESFDFEVADYLLKPFSFDRFSTAINRVKKKLVIGKQAQQAADTFFVKADKEYHQVQYKDVLYIEGFGQYCKIHLHKKTLLTLERLSNLEQTLFSSDFLRVHKSFIVSIKQMESVSGHAVTIADKKIPIGQSYRKSVFTSLGLKKP